MITNTTKSNAQIVETPDGLHISRDGKMRHHYYGRMTAASARRMWAILERCLQVVNRPVFIWN